MTENEEIANDEGILKDKSLSEKRFKFYTGDTIEGCKEWYWANNSHDVKEAVKRILEQLKDVDEYSDALYIVEKEMGDKLSK